MTCINPEAEIRRRQMKLSQLADVGFAAMCKDDVSHLLLQAQDHAEIHFRASYSFVARLPVMSMRSTKRALGHRKNGMKKICPTNCFLATKRNGALRKPV